MTFRGSTYLGRGKNITCATCGEVGHWSKLCPLKPFPRYDQRVCQGCNFRGHTQHDCPWREEMHERREEWIALIDAALHREYDTLRRGNMDVQRVADRYLFAPTAQNLALLNAAMKHVREPFDQAVTMGEFHFGMRTRDGGYSETMTEHATANTTPTADATEPEQQPVRPTLFDAIKALGDGGSTASASGTADTGGLVVQHAIMRISDPNAEVPPNTIALPTIKNTDEAGKNIGKRYVLHLAVQAKIKRTPMEEMRVETARPQGNPRRAVTMSADDLTVHTHATKKRRRPQQLLRDRAHNIRSGNRMQPAPTLTHPLPGPSVMTRKEERDGDDDVDTQEDDDDDEML